MKVYIISLYHSQYAFLHCYHCRRFVIPASYTLGFPKAFSLVNNTGGFLAIEYGHFQLSLRFVSHIIIIDCHGHFSSFHFGFPVCIECHSFFVLRILLAASLISRHGFFAGFTATIFHIVHWYGSSAFSGSSVLSFGCLPSLYWVTSFAFVNNSSMLTSDSIY